MSLFLRGFWIESWEDSLWSKLHLRRILLTKKPPLIRLKISSSFPQEGIQRRALPGGNAHVQELSGGPRDNFIGLDWLAKRHDVEQRRGGVT